MGKAGCGADGTGEPYSSQAQHLPARLRRRLTVPGVWISVASRQQDGPDLRPRSSDGWRRTSACRAVLLARSAPAFAGLVVCFYWKPTGLMAR